MTRVLRYGAGVVRILALAILLLACSGCGRLSDLLAPEQDWIVPTVRPDPAYEEFFPYYAEICAVSQFRPLVGEPSGIPGHAVMYLKGSCRDETAPYPRLRRCRHVASRDDDPEHGVGISVNKWFKNVNWVAIPGRRLFFEGNLDRWDVLDRAHFDETVEAALRRDLFRGVEIHSPLAGKPAPPIEAFVRERSAGTDFALRFGRSVFCARLPLTEPMLERAQAFLNDLNLEYFEGDADYEWSGYADNCVHTLHNALAAAGIWAPKSVRAVKLEQLFNLAVPANEFVELARLIKFPIEEFDAVWEPPERRRALLQEHWVPAQPGALVKTLSVHQENELYDTKFRLFVLEWFLRRQTTREARAALNDARLRELDSNLRFFRFRYEAILANRGDASWTEAVRGSEYQQGLERYYAYIETHRADVQRMLDQLRDREREAASQGEVNE
jgi:hypothetical protein